MLIVLSPAGGQESGAVGMTPNEETFPSGIPITHLSSARLRVGGIGEVTGVGPCWSLAYDHCEHVQEFAREGLEDPDRLVLCIQRNFSECLTCRIAAAPPLKASHPPLDDNTLVTDLMGQPPAV
jgi:hypothetical protein